MRAMFATDSVDGVLLIDADNAFNRVNQISSEGGIQDAEYIAKTYAERVRTVSTGTPSRCAMARGGSPS